MEVIVAFEELFFNIIDRIDSRTYITLEILGPEWVFHDRPRSPGVVVMALSYFGGPVIVELTLRHFCAGHLKPDFEHDLTTEDGRLGARLWVLFLLLTEPLDAKPTPSTLRKLLNLRELIPSSRNVPPGDFRRVFGAELPVKVLEKAAADMIALDSKTFHRASGVSG